MISVSPDLFLASSSLTRKELLKTHGIELDIVPPEIDEDDLKKEFCINLSATETAMFLAKAKAKSVSLLSRKSFFIAAILALSTLDFLASTLVVCFLATA
jgi:predicted house-cleaning NTP pyrophosphatase (Maf/HAM1 superfamily)